MDASGHSDVELVEPTEGIDCETDMEASSSLTIGVISSTKLLESMRMNECRKFIKLLT